MFVQVITGRVTDRAGLRRQHERWQEDLRLGAPGYLGTTAGVTDEGRFVVLARFESEAAARANSAREEQGAWWAETEKCLEDVSFADCTKVTTLLGGGSDDAGFVQIMRGRVTDPQKMEAVEPRMGEFETAMHRIRPDILGEMIVEHGDGTYTDAVYFTSEADARAGESQSMPDDVAGLFNEIMSAIAIDEFLDLKEPWLV